MFAVFRRDQWPDGSQRSELLALFSRETDADIWRSTEPMPKLCSIAGGESFCPRCPKFPPRRRSPNTPRPAPVPARRGYSKRRKSDENHRHQRSTETRDDR